MRTSKNRTPQPKQLNPSKNTLKTEKTRKRTVVAAIYGDFAKTCICVRIWFYAVRTSVRKGCSTQWYVYVSYGCWFLVCLLFFHCVSAGHHYDKQSRQQVVLYVHVIDFRCRCVPLLHSRTTTVSFVRCRQYFFQTPTNRCTGSQIVSGHKLVSCENRERTPMLYIVEWIPAAILVQFAH